MQGSHINEEKKDHKEKRTYVMCQAKKIEHMLYIKEKNSCQAKKTIYAMCQGCISIMTVKP